MKTVMIEPKKALMNYMDESAWILNGELKTSRKGNTRIDNNRSHDLARSRK